MLSLVVGQEVDSILGAYIALLVLGRQRTFFVLDEGQVLAKDIIYLIEGHVTYIVSSELILGGIEECSSQYADVQLDNLLQRHAGEEVRAVAVQYILRECLLLRLDALLLAHAAAILLTDEALQLLVVQLRHENLTLQELASCCECIFRTVENHRSVILRNRIADSSVEASQLLLELIGSQVSQCTGVVHHGNSIGKHGHATCTYTITQGEAIYIILGVGSVVQLAAAVNGTHRHAIEVAIVGLRSGNIHRLEVLSIFALDTTHSLYSLITGLSYLVEFLNLAVATYLLNVHYQYILVEVLLYHVDNILGSNSSYLVGIVDNLGWTCTCVEYVSKVLSLHFARLHSQVEVANHGAFHSLELFNGKFTAGQLADGFESLLLNRCV